MQVVQCYENTGCALWIGTFMTILWGLNLVYDSVPSVWRPSLNLSMPQITIMNTSWRRSVEGPMLAVVARCGAFLFALLSAERPSRPLVQFVGLAGFNAGLFCLVSEIYTDTKERIRRTVESP